MPSKFGQIAIAPVLVRSIRAATQIFERSLARDAIVGLAFLSTTAWLKLHAGLARLAVDLLAQACLARARGNGRPPQASEPLSKLTLVAELAVWRGETALYLEAAAAAAIRNAEDECRQARARCQAFMTLPQGAEALEDTDSIAA